MQKKIPQRQCMGRRERKEKRAMIRVVRCTDGQIQLDFSGNMACLAKARKSRALERCLETPIPDEVYARLEKEMEVAERG